MTSPDRAVRPPRQRVDGVLLLDKPAGLSSNTALQRARWLLNAAKAGHTGTLDPLASGLLPLCFGEATKFAQALLDARKEYLATVQFGRATTTGDAEGSVTAEAPVAFTRDELVATLAGFVGRSDQVAPRYAALKHEGRNLYEYARAGIDVPPKNRTIEIDTLELVSLDGTIAVLRVGCSKGTYVRALAEDVARKLGSLAHLAGLRRLGSGPLRIESAITMEALEALPPAARPGVLLPIDAPLGGMTTIDLDANAAAALLHGKTVAAPEGAIGRLRAYGPAGRFLGVVEALEARLRPVRLVDTHPAPQA